MGKINGGGRSPERTMLGTAVFPEMREFAGKFLKISPFTQVFTLSHAAISMAYFAHSLRIGAGK